MKTIEDLPFLKAQAAELERLIAIAPPTAVIAKYQYQQKLDAIVASIQDIERGLLSPIVPKLHDGQDGDKCNVLVVMTGKHKGKRIRLRNVETFIGRDEGATIRIDVSGVSEKHCGLTVCDAGVLVHDSGSQYGTFINGSPISEDAILRPGDTLTIGPMTFVLKYSSDKEVASMVSKQLTAEQIVSDDDIAGWLKDELGGYDDTFITSSSETILVRGRSKETSHVCNMSANEVSAKSVREVAEDIIRRHLESEKASE